MTDLWHTLLVFLVPHVHQHVDLWKYYLEVISLPVNAKASPHCSRLHLHLLPLGRRKATFRTSAHQVLSVEKNADVLRLVKDTFIVL